MLNRLLHHPGLRLLAAIFGTLLCALGVNLFIVPLGFYTGGLMGFCQILRTLLLSGLNFSFGTFDMAGILYFLINIPILLYAWRALGRGMVLRTLICTVTSSLFYAVVPIPSAPIMEDPLTACLLGGIFVGVGSGVVLTCSATVGGLDIIGVCLSSEGSPPAAEPFHRALAAPSGRRRPLQPCPGSPAQPPSAGIAPPPAERRLPF